MSTTEEMSTNEDLIGRADVNDLEAILAVTNTDVDEAIHAVAGQRRRHLHVGLREGRRPALNKLYEKAKTSQWNGETDLRRGTIEVDQEARRGRQRRRRTASWRRARPHAAPASSTWDDEEWLELGVESRTGRSASSCTASRAR